MQNANAIVTTPCCRTASYDCSIDDVRRKVALDLAYIERRSMVEDLRIMARTLPVMILRKGAH